MIWSRKRKSDWRRWFAIIPVPIGDEVVWLQWFWWKPCGEYDIRSAVDPEKSAEETANG